MTGPKNDYMPRVGDHFAAIVRDATFGQMARGERAPLTEVIVTKVDCGNGCPDSHKGTHLHVGTGERKLRPRSVLLKRFDLSGRIYGRAKVRSFAGHGKYYLVQRASQAVKL